MNSLLAPRITRLTRLLPVLRSRGLCRVSAIAGALGLRAGRRHAFQALGGGWKQQVETAETQGPDMSKT